ncbi:MAG TPA: hypothetical protein PKE25_03400, partial [Novosphingobium sp.]|nr:hypothetical protein [Novosphingobium sp.]
MAEFADGWWTSGDGLKLHFRDYPGDAGRLPSWLATHPYPEDRLLRTEQRLAAVGRAFSGPRGG